MNSFASSISSEKKSHIGFWVPIIRPIQIDFMGVMYVLEVLSQLSSYKKKCKEERKKSLINLSVAKRLCTN
jgi:hypothetical protein